MDFAFSLSEKAFSDLLGFSFMIFVVLGILVILGLMVWKSD